MACLIAFVLTGCAATPAPIEPPSPERAAAFAARGEHTSAARDYEAVANFAPANVANDFKLLAAIGAWLGWQALPLVILLSSLAGALIGIALIAAARMGRSVPMPFGPYLVIAGVVALVWGDGLIAGYLKLLG
jgi:hypothetical protein